MSGCRVYLGNLSDDSRERDVERFLKGYGKLRDVILKGSYGFVEFEDRRDATDAVKDLDGKEMNGGRIRVEHARDSRDSRRDGGGRDDRRGGGGRDGGRDGGRFGGGGGGRFGGGGGGGDSRRGNPPGRRTNYRLIVENLSSRTSWQDLKDYMRKAGEITYTNTHNIRSGEGIVEFGSRSAMEYAIDKLDDTELDGRKIRLTEENKKSRSRSRSRSRRNDRSRSRSRSKSRGSRSRSESDRD